MKLFILMMLITMSVHSQEIDYFELCDYEVAQLCIDGNDNACESYDDMTTDDDIGKGCR